MGYPWKGRGAPGDLSESDFARAAERLGCEVAAIKAVWQVEASGRHFLADGSVVRRFEPHHFPIQHWRAIGFSVRAGEEPWRASVRLSCESMFLRAARIDLGAAIAASSWGAPQIMAGMNHVAAGFDSPEAMVEHMAISAAHQLGAFVQLVEAWGIAGAIRGHDWQAFARRYNGSGQVAEYARRMEAAYREHSGGQRSPVVVRVGDRGPAVRELQRALGIKVDGAFGPQTHDEVLAFQSLAGVPVDGVVGARTWEALRAHEPVHPPAQETPADVRADLTAQIGGATAVVSGGAVAMGQVRDVVPDDLWNMLAYAAVGALVIWGASMAFRRWRVRV
ncbi:N-acetylmuramidase domain-containing protein [Pararhodobacter sp.]|uniref:N-acetylmuramidase domain-containing protein n=1 Tax=Pararhodobacter sp. TaxID=2127056 RepID=UPI002FDE9615